MWLTGIILAFVTLQRIGELMLARRNTRRLLARGGVEAAAGHYPLMVGFHALWLAGLWMLAWGRDISWGWLVVFLMLQAARGWVIASLGERWTTRIITLPGELLITAGPYRYLKHPNYVVVVGEILALPMVFGLVWYAVAASALNAVVLSIRIRAEQRALASLRENQSVGGPN